MLYVQCPVNVSKENSAKENTNTFQRTHITIVPLKLDDKPSSLLPPYLRLLELLEILQCSNHPGWRFEVFLAV